MEQNFALNAAEVEAGFILTCQSRPTTPTVAVDYENRGDTCAGSAEIDDDLHRASRLELSSGATVGNLA